MAHAPIATLDAAVDQFLRYLAAERALSANTVAAYSRDCAALLSALEGQGVREPAAVLPGHLVGFLEELQQRGLAARSRARALAAVRGLFGYLAREGAISRDPSRELRRPRLGRRLPHSIGRPAVEKLLGGTDDTLLVQRDVAMIELIYATGLRVSEVVSIKVVQVNLEAGFLTVVGKGRKERAVPIGTYARTRVLAYLNEVRPLLLRGRLSPSLFVTRAARPMTRQGFWKRLRLRGHIVDKAFADLPDKVAYCGRGSSPAPRCSCRCAAQNRDCRVRPQVRHAPRNPVAGRRFPGNARARAGNSCSPSRRTKSSRCPTAAQGRA